MGRLQGKLPLTGHKPKIATSSETPLYFAAKQTLAESPNDQPARATHTHDFPLASGGPAGR